MRYTVGRERLCPAQSLTCPIRLAQRQVFSLESGCLLELVWKIRKKAKNSNFRKAIKLQRGTSTWDRRLRCQFAQIPVGERTWLC